MRGTTLTPRPALPWPQFTGHWRPPLPLKRPANSLTTTYSLPWKNGLESLPMLCQLKGFSACSCLHDLVRKEITGRPPSTTSTSINVYNWQQTTHTTHQEQKEKRKMNVVTRPPPAFPPTQTQHKDEAFLARPDLSSLSPGRGLGSRSRHLMPYALSYRPLPNRLPVAFARCVHIDRLGFWLDLVGRISVYISTCYSCYC